MDLENKKPNFFSRLYWGINDLQYVPPNIITGIKNLIHWIPIIWKDRDWDQHYIFEVLKRKLIKQAKYIGSRDFHTRAKRDAEIMMLCVRLIEKVQDETYSSEYMDYHQTEMLFKKIEDSDLHTLEIKELSQNFDEYFKKYPRQYKKVMNGELNIFKRENKDLQVIAMEIAHENQKRCQDLLFKILNNNINNWWD
jgi:hypothetical protein